MPRSSPPPLPPDLAAVLDALPEDERRAFIDTWEASVAPPAPRADPARKAATWEHVHAAMAAPARADRAPVRAPRRSANAPLWRVYAGGVSLAALVLLALSWWLQPGAGSYQAGETARAIVLDDGTTVTLAPHSTLTVAALQADTRRVALVGTARFDVAPDAGRPFEVATPDASVTVLGTVFTVYARTAGTTRVQVEEGRVALAHGPHRVELTADEQGVVRANGAPAVRAVPSSPAARFAFADAPASRLFEEVEVLFGLAVAYPPDLAARRVTITRHGPLDAEALVASICAPLGVTYTRTATGFRIAATP